MQFRCECTQAALSNLNAVPATPAFPLPHARLALPHKPDPRHHRSGIAPPSLLHHPGAGPDSAAPAAAAACSSAALPPAPLRHGNQYSRTPSGAPSSTQAKPSRVRACGRLVVEGAGLRRGVLLLVAGVSSYQNVQGASEWQQEGRSATETSTCRASAALHAGAALSTGAAAAVRHHANPKTNTSQTHPPIIRDTRASRLPTCSVSSARPALQPAAAARSATDV